MPDPDFKLKPSRQYAALLLITLFISAGIVMALSFALWMKGIAVLAIALYGWHLLWAVALMHGKFSVTRFKRLDDGRWSLHTPGGIYDADLLGDTTVTNVVSVLRFQVPNRRLPLSSVVFKDALINRDYRQLLVVLRTLARA